MHSQPWPIWDNTRYDHLSSTSLFCILPREIVPQKLLWARPGAVLIVLFESLKPIVNGKAIVYILRKRNKIKENIIKIYDKTIE